MIDFVRFCQDYSIEYRTDDHKHTREGWMQIKCPFCSGHEGWHLGYEYATGRFTCWRCGWHHVFKVVQTLAVTTDNKTYALLRKYKQRASARAVDDGIKYAQHCQFPPGTGDLNDLHINYLIEKRNFDPGKIVAEWNIQGTGPVGRYKHRLIIPIYLQGELISWQARDATEKSKLRYDNCPIEESVSNPKHTLYGIDQARNDSIVVCEGVTDVWRLGYGAVATFGIKYTVQQVQVLRQFKRVCILFDTAENQAMEQANKLADTLATFCEAEVIVLEEFDGDPAQMSDEQADMLMKELI